jgi:hypothetical protein
LHTERDEAEDILTGEPVDCDYTSGPVDTANPGFDSLLSALKAFHEGQVGLDVLRIYHRELSRKLDESARNIEAMKVRDEAAEIKNLSLGALTYTRDAIDRLKDYIDNPGPDTLGQCVDSFLRSRGAVTFVNRKLDENILAAGIES